MPEYTPDFARAWVEFPDPDFDPETEDAPAQVFRCDLTWLTSNYVCIFGRGCKGIYEDRPDDGCCTLGAHFTEPADLERVKTFADELTPETWQYHRADWTEEDEDGVTKTTVVDDACVFLNRPGWPTGAGCALHSLAIRRNLSHVETKPEVCWQVPIARSYREVERKDGSEYLEVTITEFDRTYWGEGGSEFHWYCTDNTEAHIGSQPLYESSADELIELMGQPAYEVLVTHCEEFLAHPQPTLIHIGTKR